MDGASPVSALFTACGVCGAISLILARAIELDILDPETWEGLTWTDVYELLRLGPATESRGRTSSRAIRTMKRDGTPTTVGA